jgi:anti-sigma factor RsiW
MGEDLDFHSWETLSAYMDGELDDIAAAMVERAVRGDPGLQDALAALRRQRASLRDWAGQLDRRPVPPGVRAVLERARRGHDTVPGRAGDNPPKE